uniref:Uncharacterized protein n=1 Tax=Arundo donax TaxID=35708 RepID=A0A0A9D0W6_ARUDO
MIPLFSCICHSLSSSLLYKPCLLCLWQTKANTKTLAVEVLVSSLYMQKGQFERGAEDHSVRLFLHNMKEQQNFCGLLSPLQAIYISEDPPMFLTRLLSLFSISQVSS